MSELPIPRHADKTYLECNSPACRRPGGKNRLIHKDKETLHLGTEVHCMYCENWLCGEYDAWGIGEPR